MRELAKLEPLKQELALAETFEEISLLGNAAAAMAEFAKKDKMATAQQSKIGEYRVAVEAKKGEWLDDNFPRGGDKPSIEDSNFEGNQREPSKMPSTKKESAQARTIARSSEEEREKIIEAFEKEGKVVTPTAVANKLKEYANPNSRKVDEILLENVLDHKPPQRITLRFNTEDDLMKAFNVALEYQMFGNGLQAYCKQEMKKINKLKAKESA